MIVNFEFLGDEPIENVITCLNYKVNKVVYFGYHQTIEKEKEKTEHFLKKYCGVQTVVFHPVSTDSIESLLSSLRKEVEHELAQKNQIFFDITGGESLMLVAFGMFAKEFETPIHMFDVRKDRLIEVGKKATRSLSRDAEERNVPLSLDMLVELRGGKINYRLHKEVKDLADMEFAKDVEALFNVSKQYSEFWNAFTSVFRSVFAECEDLHMTQSANVVANRVRDSHTKLNQVSEFNEVLYALERIGVIKDFKCSDGRYSLRIRNESIKNCLWDAGTVLELYTCQVMKDKCDDCFVGVHLDWDGVIHEHSGQDVLNEIDVLGIQGYQLLFVSCKNGKLNSHGALHAIYELETVAQRFGGKYANKMLALAEEIPDAYKMRAEELGIKCIKL